MEKDLKIAVRRIIREDGGESVWERLKGRGWSEKEVLEMVLEIEEEEGEGERDAEALLRAVRLSRKILGADEDDNAQGDESRSQSLEEIRREMSAARQTLVQEVDEDREMEDDESEEDADDKAPGWALWEGPWTPTPIGTVIR